MLHTLLDAPLHQCQAVEVEAQVLKDGGSVAQHVVRREDRTDFVGVVRRSDDERHVVFGVSGRMNGLYLHPAMVVTVFVRPEPLAVLDVEYALRVQDLVWVELREMLVDFDIWDQGFKIFDATDVVVVPVREDRGGDGGLVFLCVQNVAYRGDPCLFTLACVDEETSRALPD